MREFKIWNQTKTASFDFKEQGILITEVSGLGVGYSATVSNGVVVNYFKEFEPISLLANFGIKSNAYTSFTNLANFIAQNGKKNLVLEYRINGRTLYTDVWLTRLPKSQKKSYNILSETLLFARMTYWYTLVTGVLTSPLLIDNKSTDDISVSIAITGPTNSTFSIILKESEYVRSSLKLNSELTTEAQILSIDAESKTVTLQDNESKVNSYNRISKEYDTFIVIPPGVYELNYTGIAGKVTYSFKKWVID